MVYLMCLFLALSSLVGCASNLEHYSSRVQDEQRLSILQGVTTADSVKMSILYPNHLVPEITILSEGQQAGTISHKKIIRRKDSVFSLVKFDVSDLQPNTTYTLEAKTSGFTDRRLFKTFPKKMNRLKFAVASCMSDEYNEIGNQIWPELFNQHPDIIVLSGDNIYADVFSGIYLGLEVDPDHLWRRYVEGRVKLALYRQPILIPIYAGWDDHDYGVNNGDKHFRFKKESAQLFWDFFAQDNSSSLTYGPGVSWAMNLADQNFVFLDNRSFRDENSLKSGEHFGLNQISWFKSFMKSHRSPSWLISGDQFFGGYHSYDSFEGQHPIAFKRFLDDLKEINNPVVFLSGDRHLVEIMDIDKSEFGLATREYTVSGIHTKMYPGSLERDPNPRRIGGFDGKPNYAVISSEIGKGKISIEFEAYSLGQEKISEDQLTLE